MIASEVGDKNFTQELDVIQLDLDDTDFVDFLVELGSENAMSIAQTDATSNAMDHSTTEQETETTTSRGRRKNVMVTERSSTSRQPRKRSKKSPKQDHPSSGGFEIEISETAECSALMATAGI